MSIIDDPKRRSDVGELLDEKGREWARFMYEEHLRLRATVETPLKDEPTA